MPHAPGLRGRECGLDREDGQERQQPRLEEGPADQGGEPDRGQGRRRDGQTDPAIAPRRVPPFGQGHGIDPRANVGAQQLQVLAEVEARPKLVDRLVPLGHRLDRRRGQQPRREHLLAGAGPRGAQELEQRALAEEVQVAGVRVIRIEEPQPGDARARPAAVQPGQPLAVELHGPGRPLAPPPERLVDQHQGDEDAQRPEQPEPAQRVVAINQEAQEQPDARDRQPGVGHPILHPAPARVGGLPLPAPRLVLGPQFPAGQLSLLGIVPHVLTRPATLEWKMPTLADRPRPLKRVRRADQLGFILPGGRGSSRADSYSAQAEGVRQQPQAPGRIGDAPSRAAAAARSPAA